MNGVGKAIRRERSRKATLRGGVVQNIGTTILGDEIADQKVSLNDIFAASLSGAVSGAFQSDIIQSKFDSEKMFNINHDKLFGGLVSNTIGSLVSTGLKDGITSGWKGINFADEFSSGISSGLGQFSHQAFQKRGFYVANLISTFTQASFGNILHSNNGSLEFDAPFKGIFDFNSIFLNILPSAVGGTMNDAYYNAKGNE